jgi:ER membrane protein complex subunit 3
MQDQMSLNAAGQMPQDPKAAFKNEWEALEITEYKNALATVCEDLLTGNTQPEAIGNHH